MKKTEIKAVFTPKVMKRIKAEDKELFWYIKTVLSNETNHESSWKWIEKQIENKS